MSMREEVLKLAEECGYCKSSETISSFSTFTERFYQAAYLAGAKAMQEESLERIDKIDDGEAAEYRACQEAIRAINPENLGGA